MSKRRAVRLTSKRRPPQPAPAPRSLVLGQLPQCRADERVSLRRACDLAPGDASDTVLDENPQGYHLEQLLQLTLQAVANERQLLVEFRLGEGSEAPSEQLLTSWLESGDLVEALCTGHTARPLLQAKDKTYRRQVKAVQVGDETAQLDTIGDFAGASMSM